MSRTHSEQSSYSNIGLHPCYALRRLFGGGDTRRRGQIKIAASVRTMSTTIRDASLTTSRRRQIANYGWRQSVGLYADPTTVKYEQAQSNSKGDGPSAAVNISVKLGALLIGQTLGACNCSTGVGPNPTLQGYDKSEGGTCSPANNGGSS